MVGVSGSEFPNGFGSLLPLLQPVRTEDVAVAEDPEGIEGIEGIEDPEGIEGIEGIGIISRLGVASP